MNTIIDIHPEVADALAAGRPVVALESTVFSTLGLPAPHNAKALQDAHDAVRTQGAVPAMTAVIAGRATVGVDPAHWEAILSSDRKVASRDLAVAVGQGWSCGVTTVSASVQLAAAAGIQVFATGGIGGVHRNATTTGDISADLPALAAHPVVTVSAGAKSFLDLPRTLEHLETLSVPVLGLGTDLFPAFTAASSGLPVPHRVDTAGEIAAIASARFALGGGGILVAVPPPEPIDPELLADATATAQEQADAAGVDGPARTPFVLAALAELTGGATVTANIALVTNNTRQATAIAVALASS